MTEHAYIHIPFCLQKCKYCSFVSGLNIEKKDIYLTSLLKEIKSKYKKENLKTLYFGGGTPSLLEPDNIYSILKCFNLNENCEITLEVNPETVVLEKFKEFKNLGINRISLGVQTFNDEILKLIGRGHSGIQAENAIRIIKDAGFNNISIDLIYGLPNQDISDWEKDIDKAVQKDIQHISTYGLKIEEGSYFYNNMPINIADDEIQANMYNLLCDKLTKYEHYEISNFALKDFVSQHNSCYWQNKEYYGFGLNASGYQNCIRYKNISIFNDYVKNPFLLEEKYILSKEETLENEIFLALRLKQGLDINKFNEKYRINFIQSYEKIINKYKKLGLLSIENDCLSLTRKGILLSNEIMSEFITL